MQQRVHTSRKNRDLTTDGLDKQHHEPKTLKVLARTASVKLAAIACHGKSRA